MSVANSVAGIPISIHAPTKGATGRGANNACFRNISIHAPTKGATLRNIFAYQLLLISIHAPTKGATHTITGNGIENIFQSTLPRRERRSCPDSLQACSKFQSTLPRRERHIEQEEKARRLISIHAPTKGATISLQKIGT